MQADADMTRMLSLARPRGAVAAALLLLLGACASSSSGPRDSELALYRRVMERVQSSYVEPVKQDQLVKESLKGMLTGLDPHSDYMDESEYEEMLADSHGEFAGIGTELTRDDSHPKIISPIDDTPAARAGLKPGDIVLRINGHPTDGISLKEAVDQLRGPAGSKVTMTILRTGQRPFDVTLTRAVIHIVSVKSRLEAGRLGYIRITTFAEKTHSEFLDSLDRLSHEACGRLDGLVLDLRNDPGGLLDSAVRIAGDFLDGGVIVSTRGRNPSEDETYEANPRGDRLRGVPVVVLVNGASASASEIVAGALQDRHRAAVLGTRSFGKGSVQTIIPLDGQGALRLTTARYYTPSGRSIQGEGITPDQIVLPPRDQQIAQATVLHETDLRGALKNTGPEKAQSVPPGVTAKQAHIESEEAAIDPQIIGSAKDYQLMVALKQLRETVARGAPPPRS